MKRLQPNKLDPKAYKCYFIGYPRETARYSFYHRAEGKVFVARHGVFLEKEFLVKEVSGRTIQLDEIIESSSSQGKELEIVQESVPVTEPQVTIPDTVTPIKPSTAPRRSSRLHLEPEWFHNEVMVSPTSTEGKRPWNPK